VTPISTALSVLLVPLDLPCAVASGLAEDVIEAPGLRGGLVVHVGCGDGKLTAAMRVGDAFLVHGLDGRALRASGRRRGRLGGPRRRVDLVLRAQGRADGRLRRARRSDRARAAVRPCRGRPVRGTNVAFVGTKDFYRPPEASPSRQGYHWNSNAETYLLIGDGMGKAMIELVR